ncbi:MAG: transcriptional regulator, partial [Chloroflexota bacterium]|nr:transcriptional regulator [Chloroflexota bacterium]
MRSLNIIKPNRYQDSVTLMQVAVRLREMAGIEDASLMMGTQPNKEMLAEAGLLTQESEAAGPNDLIIAMRGTDEAVEVAQGRIEDLLRAEIPPSGERQASEPHSLSAGLAALPDANLVLISTPGIYAAAEAHKALLQGRHVMIFSDNVSLEDEYALKVLAAERGLLLMGPDCGTAIIGGVPLGFANAVRRGGIGVVGASGTGMQEITSLVSRLGGGISHAIGTGSRDLSARIRGKMTVVGVRALLKDPATSVIVVVSKPPHPDAAERVLAEVSHAEKPVVVAFLGVDVE